MERPLGVLGATGRTGGATVRHLLARGARVRAFTRDPNSAGARTLVDAGAEVATLDMGDTSGLDLSGIDRLFSVQQALDGRGRHRGEAEVREGANVASAAARAGVRHVVQISAGLGEPTGIPHFDSKLAIRAEFEKRGVTVTAIHPAPFMELMVDPTFAPAVAAWGVEPRIVGWDQPLPWVAVDDIGRVAADALTADVPTDGATIPLVGDIRSLAGCRTLLAEAGRRPKRRPIPTALFRVMVGEEFLQMWRWAASIDPPARTPGLMGVPEWVTTL